MKKDVCVCGGVCLHVCVYMNKAKERLEKRRESVRGWGGGGDRLSLYVCFFCELFRSFHSLPQGLLKLAAHRHVFTEAV